MHDQLIEHFRFHAAESIGVDAVQDHPESEVVFDAVEIEQGPPIPKGECQDTLLAAVDYPNEDKAPMKLIAEARQCLVCGVCEVGEPPRLTSPLRGQIESCVVLEIGSHMDRLDSRSAA